VSVATIERVRQRFVEEGLETALSPRPPRRLYLRKLDGEAEARLIALACSPPPEGRARWTLELLADEMVKLTEHADLSRETVRRRLAENELKNRLLAVPGVAAVERLGGYLREFATRALTEDSVEMEFLTDDPVAQAVTYQRVTLEARAPRCGRYGCATAGPVNWT